MSIYFVYRHDLNGMRNAIIMLNEKKLATKFIDMYFQYIKIYSFEKVMS